MPRDQGEVHEGAEVIEVWEYYMPTRIVFGNGCLDSAGEGVRKSAPRKVMLVTGKSAMERLGITGRVCNGVLKGIDVEVWNKAAANPSVDLVREGTEFSKQEGIDYVIGLGGGSAMDLAKCIAILNNNYQEGDIRDHIKKPGELIKRKGLPFMAIPTTSGTGSEVTPWATVWDIQNESKLSLSHPFMYAHSAIVDPELTVKLPRQITVSTGLDALAQGIESFWSRNSNPISDSYAEGAVRLAIKNLKGAREHPENIEYRGAMSLAALYSGLAINGTKTTACHSISYPMTLKFGIPHGHACALTIPGFIGFNNEAVPDRIERISHWFGVASAEEVAARMTNLMSELGVETRLSKLGIGSDGIEYIIKNGFTPDRVKNNPREVTEDDLRGILEGID
jgi:phosphonate metabolism-associated iron-containing alcohol dehydrogenase